MLSEYRLPVYRAGRCRAGALTRKGATNACILHVSVRRNRQESLSRGSAIAGSCNARWLISLTSFGEAVRFVQVFSYVQEHGSPARRRDAGRHGICPEHDTDQNSGSNPQKLPPPPTIDANVNQNETLSAVRYDNKYEIYGGLGFSHFKAGPQLAAGANLGGFDVQGTWWLTAPAGRHGERARLLRHAGRESESVWSERAVRLRAHVSRRRDLPADLRASMRR